MTFLHKNASTIFAMPDMGLPNRDTLKKRSRTPRSNARADSHNRQRGDCIADANPGAAIFLTDIMMPGMDGYETIRLIRSNPLFGCLQIVEAGASDYLAKPVNADSCCDSTAMASPVGRVYDQGSD